MSDRSLKERLQVFGMERVLDFLDADPDRNIPRLIDWFAKFEFEGIAEKARAIKEVTAPDNNWGQLIRSLWTDIDKDVRKRLFVNFVIHAGLISLRERERLSREHGCNIPWAILMDPTSACNLQCAGCWAAEYGRQMSLSFAELDDIIRQGKELGVHMYIYSGGEPTIRKDDIFRLCEKHDDCVFLAFTNGTLIDEAFADEMLRVRNFVPAISVEGFEEATDSRRGAGTYQAVVRAMDVLREKRLLFGVSVCYTSQNVEAVVSEAFIDDIIQRGAKFAWYFTYIPVGHQAVPELLVSPEQREFVYWELRRFRETKPIFTMDFWNDGEYPKGCIAGGRYYLHINANGDVEPCAFIHYSDSNIREKSLLEALKSPLFMQYRARHPFNQNHLRPCPLLDNPHQLAAMVDASGARSTELQQPEDVHHLTAKCEDAAVRWAPVADLLWQERLAEREAAATRG
jgi:MoaA/NifB/PqqE/SkfB family radical SAM enzyme